jgi:hypothetical protein
MAVFSMPKSEAEFKDWLLELVRTLDAAKFLEVDAETLNSIGEEIKNIIQDVAHLF